MGSCLRVGGRKGGGGESTGWATTCVSIGRLGFLCTSLRKLVKTCLSNIRIRTYDKNRTLHSLNRCGVISKDQGLIIDVQ